MNQKIRYLGFMTCNFIINPTDDCISYEDLKKNLVFMSPLQRRILTNLDIKIQKINIILWKKENNCPVVVFRILFEDKDVIFPSIDNTRKIFAK